MHLLRVKQAHSDCMKSVSLMAAADRPWELGAKGVVTCVVHIGVHTRTVCVCVCLCRVVCK